MICNCLQYYTLLGFLPYSWSLSLSCIRMSTVTILISIWGDNYILHQSLFYPSIYKLWDKWTNSWFGRIGLSDGMIIVPVDAGISLSFLELGSLPHWLCILYTGYSVLMPVFADRSFSFSPSSSAGICANPDWIPVHSSRLLSPREQKRAVAAPTRKSKIKVNQPT